MTEKSFMVLGDPISHSLSPKIHSTAYEVLGLDWSYGSKQLAKGSLASFLETTSADGFSLTMPLKYEAAALADERHPLVSLTGVANTLIRSNTGWQAYNTDVFGASKALESVLDRPLEVVSLLGAGATAKSVMVAISKVKPFALFDIYVRDSSRTTEIVELAGELNVFTSVHELGEFSNFQELTVNTLPLNASEALPVLDQSGFLFNVNYSGADVALVGSFDPNKVISGHNMLVWQALQQIRLFNGLKIDQVLPNEDLIVKAMFDAL